jgi:lipopolysaccharide transport system ATP-binding protein
MPPIIKVENISKCYRIGGLDPGYITFRETLAKAVVSPIKRLRGRGGAALEEVWALKEINFEVESGEMVGIIGHNGAGKSTLLKILSHITVPTTGRSEVYGRVGSLLEVGTGFHPDLTGRENIFLNGTILGIRREEIARRFDEIVDFSGISNYIDTPVKWYSSGMYLRLAFSVAAHLNTEVLFMDEVLAVGDVAFQFKCLDKMHEIRQQGRTILFVSHSMAAVTRLCKRAILLEKGRMLGDGPAEQIVNEYLGASLKVTSRREWANSQTAPGNEIVRLRQVRVRNQAGETIESTDIRCPVGIEFTYDVLQPGHILTPKLDLYNEQNAHLFSAHDVQSDWRHRTRPAGRYVSVAWLPGNFLSEGNLFAHVSLASHTPATILHAHEPNVVTFGVVDNQHKDSARGDYVGPIAGAIRPILDWTTDLYTEQETREIPSAELTAG